MSDLDLFATTKTAVEVIEQLDFVLPLVVGIDLLLEGSRNAQAGETVHYLSIRLLRQLGHHLTL